MGRFAFQVIWCFLLSAGATGIAASSAAAVGNNQFSLALYQKLATKPGNLVCSPYSVRTAGAMATAGARGATATQLRKALVLPESNDESAGATIGLLPGAAPSGEGFEISSANALWSQAGYRLRADYLRVIHDVFHSEITSLDFGKNTRASRRINEWVGKATHGRIPELVTPQMFNAATRLVLTNAIYFKASWMYPFETERTETKPFWTDSTNHVTAPLMHQLETFSYAENKELQVLELPYRGEAFSMVLLLPRDKGALPTVEKGLSREGIETLISELQPRMVQLWLPRFRVTSSLSLVDPLKPLGIRAAFDAKAADFSGMNGKKELFLSVIVQKAVAIVDEAGTEAAAATAVVAEAGGPPPNPEKAVRFRADHPFLFLIRHRQSGAWFFMGRVSSPEKE